MGHDPQADAPVTKSKMACPHCGWTYDPDVSGYGTVPWHNVRSDDPNSAFCEKRALGLPEACPGVGQCPRNADSDKRPLWSHGQAMTDHPLPKPKFSDRERAAYNWLMARKIRPWVVDLVTKQCKTATANYPSIIAYARHLGWEG